jgi:hypothetical protein
MPVVVEVGKADSLEHGDDQSSRNKMEDKEGRVGG